MNCGGIVLCGGESRRMGTSKALLPFGPETMLQRVVGILATVVHPLVVVAAKGQELPELPKGVQTVVDREPERGPLEGLRNGLGALVGLSDAAFATSCDVPLLNPAFVRAIFDGLGNHDICVPTEGRFYHPLAACYRTCLVERIDGLLLAGERRPATLFGLVDTRTVSVEELQSCDPDLRSLLNINRPEDYRTALDIAGFPMTSERRLGEGPS